MNMEDTLEAVCILESSFVSACVVLAVVVDFSLPVDAQYCVMKLHACMYT